jgi:hypothetical protein
VTGELEVTAPAYIPVDNLLFPNQATHYKVIATGAELNFTDYTEVHNKQTSAFIALDSNASAPLTLTCALPANSTHPLVLSLGIEFYIDDDGQKYPLRDGSAHAIVKVDV